MGHYRLHSLLEQSALLGLRQQGRDGSMPPGHNGPWGDRETPLRNTGNWLHLFLWAYERSGSRALRRGVEGASRYLLDGSHRPAKGAFLHLPERARQEGNGLIGQAWTLAALFDAYRILAWDELAANAHAVLRRHAFDTRLGLWQTMDLPGKALGVNPTLNQQIWFAAAALRDPRPDQETNRRIRRFLECLPAHVRLSRSGRIGHWIHPKSMWRRFPMGWRAFLASLPARKASGRERSVGYHAFVLYGLSLLVERTFAGEPWDQQSIRRGMKYGRSPGYRRDLQGNRFAYGYNPTGIEMAHAELCFPEEAANHGEDWIQIQFGHTYDLETARMVRNSVDPATLAGRLCEATGLPDQEVVLP